MTDGLLAALILLLLCAAIVVLTREGERLSGAVTVVDGDSLRMVGRDIRLKGLDAPELHQSCTREGASWPCGQAARDELRRLVAGAPIECRVSGRDRYGRSLARCEVAGRDLGSLLVARGLAVAYGDYEREEEAARAGRVGVWAGPFERPSDWRKSHPRPAAGPVL